MLFIAADHDGFKAKEYIVHQLEDRHVVFEDFGTFSEVSVDYPGFAKRVAKAVLAHNGRGILLCKSGAGMAIVANRFRGIRAVVAWDEKITREEREDNDANILCLPAFSVSHEQAWQLVSTFLSTTFSFEDRHVRRIKQIDAITNNDQ